MTRTTTTATALFVLMLAIPSGAALHCNGNITTISAGGETIYIDDRSSGPGELNHWIYLESNDTPGLQSGGEDIWLSKYPYFPYNSDACGHPDHDTLVL